MKDLERRESITFRDSTCALADYQGDVTNPIGLNLQFQRLGTCHDIVKGPSLL